MFGEAMTDDNQNPYAVPTLQPPLNPGEKHHALLFTERGIRFHKGLELPKICLVTGRTDGLVPRIVRLEWMSPFVKVITYGVLPSTSIVPIGFLFILNGYFSQNLNQMLDSLIIGVLVAVFIFGTGLSLVNANWATNVVVRVIRIAAISGLIAGGWRWRSIQKSRKCFRGLKLKVLGYDAEQFEVGGFTPEYFEALRTETVRQK